MRIDVADDVSVQEWQQLVDRSAAATFFHTPLWYDASCRSLADSRTRIRKFVFEDGKVAILPLLERRWAGLRRTLLSGPAGSYGGWVCADALDEDQASTLTTLILESSRNLVWRINPLEAHRALLEQRATQSDTTEILALDRFRNEEALLQGYRHSVRKQIKKGARAGLEVREAVVWPDWASYYEVYRRSLRRWGNRASSHYPLSLFRHLHAAGSPAVKLWIVRAGDVLVGGNLNCYQGRHCVEWHASFDERFSSLGTRNFLVHHVVADALAQGFGVYDFNPSGGHEGTRRFKRSFGTTSVPSGVIHKRDTLSLVLAKARRWLPSFVQPGRRVDAPDA